VGELYYDTTTNTLYYWNGTTWVSAVAIGGGTPPTRTVLAAAGSGTYTPPNGCRAILVECLGGGGTGGQAQTGSSAVYAAGSGGNGGNYAAKLIQGPASSYAYTVGAGGAAIVGGTASSNNGGDTSFGASVCVAKGGQGGAPDQLGGTGYRTTSAYGPQAGDVGDLILKGFLGEPGQLMPGGTLAIGGKGGMPAGPYAGGYPGQQLFVSGNSGGGGNLVGPNAYGCGSSGSVAGQFSGAATNVAAGGGGLIVITEYYGNVGGGAPTRTVLAGSGTYLLPQGCTAVLVECIGGGGGGGGTAATGAGATADGAGGGGGAYAAKLIQNPSTSYTYTVGAAGAGTSNAAGGNGGNTSFGASLVVAAGGAGGDNSGSISNTSATSATNGGLGGASGSVGDVVQPGQPGDGTLAPMGTVAYGGAGGASGSGSGGARGSRTASVAAGTAATGYGGGGSGAAAAASQAAQAGGNGAPGTIIVTEFYPGAGGVRVFSQDWSVGPPSNPQNGDVWYATNVDGNGVVWQFRYNATSASAYKWEFIGGPDLTTGQQAGKQLGVANAWAQVASVALGRAGDYNVYAAGQFNLYPGNGLRYAGIGHSSGPTWSYQNGWTYTGGVYDTFAGWNRITGIPAGASAICGGFTTVDSRDALYTITMAVHPIRVS
jgi:hypothetical protein